VGQLLAVLFRGGRTVFSVVRRSARELWRKITRQSPSTRTSAPPEPSGPAEFVKKLNGGISSTARHRQAVHRLADWPASGADGARSRLSDCHGRAGQIDAYQRVAETL
jgi:hypothetical protein